MLAVLIRSFFSWHAGAAAAAAALSHFAPASVTIQAANILSITLAVSEKNNTT